MEKSLNQNKEFLYGFIELTPDMAVEALSKLSINPDYSNWLRRINTLCEGKRLKIGLTYSRAVYLGLQEYFEEEIV